MEAARSQSQSAKPSRDALEAFVESVSVFVERVTGVLEDLVSSHADLVAVVETMETELAAMSGAAGERERSAQESMDAAHAQAEQARRQAGVLLGRAQEIVERSHAVSAGARSVAGRGLVTAQGRDPEESSSGARS